jgi:hypothetical protein
MSGDILYFRIPANTIRDLDFFLTLASVCENAEDRSLVNEIGAHHLSR